MAITIPVETDTSRALRGLSDLEDAARKSGDKVKTSMDAAGKGFGSAGSGVAKLAGAADMLAPSMGGAARSVADLADVGEVAAAAATALGLSLGTTLLVVAPLALAVVGLASAWKAEAEAIAKAAENQKQMSQALAPIKDVVSAASDEVRKLAVAQGAMSKTTYDAIAINKKWDASLASATAAAQEQYDALVAGQDADTDNADAIAQRTAAIATATAAVKNGREAELARLSWTNEQADSEAVLAARLKQRSESERAASKGAAARAKETAEATKRDAEAAQAATVLARMMVEAEKLAEDSSAAYRKAAKSLAGLTTSARAMTETEEQRAQSARDAALAQADSYARSALAAAESSGEMGQIEQELADARIAIQESYEAKLDALREDRVQKEADAAQKAADEAEKAAQAQIDRINGIYSAMSSADSALSALSTAGPWGAFIAGLISFIKDFDESLLSFSEFHMDFTKTLGELPQTLLKHLQDTLVESSVAALTMIPKFMQSLADNIGPMIEAILRAIPEIVAGFAEAMAGSQMWKPIGIQIAVGIWKSLVSVASDARSAVSAWVGDVWDGFTTRVSAWWQNFASGEWIRGIAEGVKTWIAGIPEALKAWWQGMKDGIGEWVDQLVKAFKERISDIFHREDERERNKKAAEKTADAIKEFFTLGLAETQYGTQYGDTPGVVQAGSQGMRARFAPRDKVVAAQTNEGLLAQVLNKVGGGGMQPAMAGSGPVTVTWDHRSFDGFLIRHAALGGRSTSVINRPTGRG